MMLEIVPPQPSRWGFQGQGYITRSRGAADRGVIAIDGEGFTDAAEYHHYGVMVAVSESGSKYVHRVAEDDPTRQLDWLFSLSERGKLMVMYGMSYDVTMLLRKLPWKVLRVLCDSTQVRWRGYYIRYIPRKQLYISDGIRKAHIYDLLGFFQCRFTDAVIGMGIATREDLESVDSMKASRANFTGVTDAIIDYSLEECRLLVELFLRLRKACQDAGIEPRSWDGAGAIAARLMRTHEVGRFRAEFPELELPIRHAYFGGRIEAFQGGAYAPVFAYDINSAYPSVLKDAPCLAHSRLRETAEWVPDSLGIWRVSWSLPRDTIAGPFPWREHDGSVLFPADGEGWHWSREVDVARSVYGTRISVARGYVLDQSCSHEPFGFVPALYARRQTLEKTDLRRHVIKLGLNSLYGKTAQRVGWGGKKPPFHSLVWAGITTSETRAALALATAGNIRSVLSMATDGILSTERLPIDTSNALGGWSGGAYDGAFVIQPGVAEVWRGSERVLKTRGFGPSEVDWEAVKLQYASEGATMTHQYTVRRFVPLKAALGRVDWQAKIGQWLPQTRRLEGLTLRRLPEGYGPDYEAVPNPRFCIRSVQGAFSHPYTISAQKPVLELDIEDENDDNSGVPFPWEV